MSNPYSNSTPQKGSEDLYSKFYNIGNSNVERMAPVKINGDAHFEEYKTANDKESVFSGYLNKDLTDTVSISEHGKLASQKYVSDLTFEDESPEIAQIATDIDTFINNLSGDNTKDIAAFAKQFNISNEDAQDILAEFV